MSLSEQFNIGARIKAANAFTPATILGSSAAATTERDGNVVDRQQSGLRQYYSCKAVVSGAFTGSSSQSIVSVVMNVQHGDSSGGGDMADYSTASEPSAVKWGTSSSGSNAGTTGGTAYNTIEQSVNLNGAKRYIRIQFTPTFGSSSSGHALAAAGTFIFGGADELPAQ